VKTAYYSPLPPERTGIADYSRLLLPALERRLEVAVVRRGAKRPPRGTDLGLYHVGNNPDAHGWIVEALERRPGVVVLHEFVLHHLVAGMTLGRGDGEGYLAAMEREHGIVGRLLAHGVIDGVLPPLWEARPHEFPLASGVLDRALGVIVHSRYLEREVRATGYTRPVWYVPHPSWPAPVELPDSGLPSGGAPIVGCLGHLNPEKRVPQLLEAFARLRSRRPDALLVLAGRVAPQTRLDAWLERFALREGIDVLVLGHVEEARIPSLLSAFDVCVNLRWPTMGETSGSAVRALGLGRPLVVSDVGWFRELPDDAAVKVAIDETEVDVLAQELEQLLDDPALRERLGAAALRYATTELALDRVADSYAIALEEAAGGEAVRDAVLADVARAAADVGLDEEDPEFPRVARKVREVMRGD
jgi:glycosyltransferase involved in cell wall biosynthesis